MNNKKRSRAIKPVKAKDLKNLSLECKIARSCERRRGIAKNSL
jgi:hypothetical protein